MTYENEHCKTYYYKKVAVKCLVLLILQQKLLWFKISESWKPLVEMDNLNDSKLDLFDTKETKNAPHIQEAYYMSL